MRSRYIHIAIREFAYLVMFIVYMYVTLLLATVIYNVFGLELTDEQLHTVQLYVLGGYFIIYVLYILKRLIKWIREGRVV